MSSYRPGPGPHDRDRRDRFSGPPPRYRDDRPPRDFRDGRFDDSRRRYDDHPALDRPLGDSHRRGGPPGRGRYERPRGDDHGRVGSFRQGRRYGTAEHGHSTLRIWLIGLYVDDREGGSYRPRSRSPPYIHARRRSSPVAPESSSRQPEDSQRDRSAPSDAMPSRIESGPSTSRRSHSPVSKTASEHSGSQAHVPQPVDTEMQAAPDTPAELEPGERLDSPLPTSIPTFSRSTRGSASEKAKGDARAIASQRASERGTSVGMAKSVSSNSSNERNARDVAASAARDRAQASTIPVTVEDSTEKSKEETQPESAGIPTGPRGARATSSQQPSSYERDSNRGSEQEPTRFELPPAPRNTGSGRVNPLLKRPDGSVRDHPDGGQRERGNYERPDRRYDDRRGGERRDDSRWSKQREPAPSSSWRNDNRASSGSSWHDERPKPTYAAQAKDEDDDWGTKPAPAPIERKAEEMDWNTTTDEKKASAWDDVPAAPKAKAWAGEATSSKTSAWDTGNQRSQSSSWADEKPSTSARSAWYASESSRPSQGRDPWSSKPGSPAKDACNDTAKPASSPAWGGNNDNRDANSPARYLSASDAWKGPSPSSTPSYRSPAHRTASGSYQQQQQQRTQEQESLPSAWDPDKAAALSAWRQHPMMLQLDEEKERVRQAKERDSKRPNKEIVEEERNKEKARKIQEAEAEKEKKETPVYKADQEVGLECGHIRNYRLIYYSGSMIAGGETCEYQSPPGDCISQSSESHSKSWSRAGTAGV